MLTTNIPDVLSFLANTGIISTVALIVWFLIVAAGVWLGEKAVEKFLGRTATQAETSASGSEGSRRPHARARASLALLNSSDRERQSS